MQFAEIEVPVPAVASVERFLRTYPGLRELALTRTGPGRLVARTVAPRDPICALLFDRGAYCAACRFVADPRSDEGRWTVVLPHRASVRPILQAIERAARGTAPAVVPVRPYRPPGALTERQARALATAYRLGYYGFPRRAGLSAVSRSLGIGRSAAAERLRRAEAKVVGESMRS
ncbi:MAG: helix-turn-helix domain-containing protein [Thermoplasmata archaeon]